MPLPHTATPRPAPTGIARGAVGLFLHDRQGRVLLLRRRGAHGAGQWGLTGGKVDFGESLPACAARELREETGISIDPTEVRIGPTITDYWPVEGRHFVDVFCSAPCPAGAQARIMEPDKADALGWFGLQSLPSPLFTPLQRVLSLGITLPFPWTDAGACMRPAGG
ncbi:nucleotide triphosphate diphosphatase NUDT15 [Oleisolibacter albus]|uniref:nucleotide triphosphate diphosphatase NUDT15 n=1 Tax=Oleisolibacter albus TaxID=2171757 RepID=UPI00187444ED|nr:NUDIX domain-containing protein [Oleisolibacter albus]